MLTWFRVNITVFDKVFMAYHVPLSYPRHLTTAFTLPNPPWPLSTGRGGKGERERSKMAKSKAGKKFTGASV
jgi:hypothetical protein